MEGEDGPIGVHRGASRARESLEKNASLKWMLEEQQTFGQMNTRGLQESAIIPLKKQPAPKLHCPSPRGLTLALMRLLPFDHQDI